MTFTSRYFQPGDYLINDKGTCTIHILKELHPHEAVLEYTITAGKLEIGDYFSIYFKLE